VAVPLDIASLTAAYAEGVATPAQVLDGIFQRIAAAGERPVWIGLAPRDRVDRQIEAIARRRDAGTALPLYGIPFAVKDNIDVAGLPTTAACPDFAYVPERSATAVERLEAAGAILVGKTNLDQFATGLTGTRSPYGICRSVFDPDYIAGGSSAGSAVAVAGGLVSFALGTDTAGSGRVPAAFNNIIGLKPTKGLISLHGVMPACRSLDCVSIFAGTAGDALRVLDIMQGFDPADAYSRPAPAPEHGFDPLNCRFGVPSGPLDFFGDTAAAALFATAIDRLTVIGGEPVAIDFTPFQQAGELLYQGPWVAERLAALRSRGFDRPDALEPSVRQIVGAAAGLSAVEAFAGFHRLAELQRLTEPQWRRMDIMLLPTTGTTYRVDEVLADPIGLNGNLGRYTNFVNLLDLSAIAVPAGFRANGLPFGVTIIGRAWQDRLLGQVADRLHRALAEASVGGTFLPLPAAPLPAAPAPAAIRLAVFGAHLVGQPLNWQLTERRARLIGAGRTGPGYRLHALAQSLPAKPGLIYDGQAKGLIELEIWELDAAGFGSFVAAIPPPLGIGTITLEDGARVKGFLCEPHALADAEDITEFGGWRRWLAAKPQPRAAI
jgi:allophanate hydrolase